MSPVALARVAHEPQAREPIRPIVAGAALVGCEAGVIALHVAFPHVFLGSYCYVLLYLCVATFALLVDRAWLSLANTVALGTVGLFFVVPPQRQGDVEWWAEGLGLTVFVGGGWLFTFLADRLRAATRREGTAMTAALRAEALRRTDAERAMRANRDTVRAILETAAQGILVADRQGTIHLANPAMAAIFGYGRDELIGQPVDVLLPDRIRTHHAAHWDAWWTTPMTRRMGVGLTVTGTRRDGSEVPLEVSLSYVDGPEARLAVGFFSDITERLRADAALRTSEQELRDLSGRLLTAVEEERRRIARELHDDIVQQLGLCAWEVDRLAIRVRPSMPEATDGLQALKDRVSRVLVDVRRLSRGLHPAALQLLGLEDALWAFCENVTQAHGPSIVFSGSLPTNALDEPAKSGLYHIAQEAIANAVAHASASEIRVDLRSVPAGVRLTIQDNGRGFTPDPSRPRGLGLVSMAERARLAGGTMTIDGSPAGGTTVTVAVPRRVPVQQDAPAPTTYR